jgi:hypothetical protein
VQLYYFHATANALLSSGLERMFWTLVNQFANVCTFPLSKQKALCIVFLFLLVAFSLFHIDVNEYAHISFTSQQFLKVCCCTLL